MLRLDEISEVLGAHAGLDVGNDGTCAEVARKHRIEAPSEAGIVDRRRSALRDLHLRKLVLRDSVGPGDAFGHPPDRSQQLRPSLFVVGPDRELEVRAVRNDVVLRAGIERADGDDAGLQRLALRPMMPCMATTICDPI
jgi:hypothetical protein